MDGEIPFEDEEIIEAMTVNFESEVDLLDLNAGIDLLGYLIADVEPGVGGVEATLLGLWLNLGQIRIVRAKKNVYSIRVGSEQLARRLIDFGPWNVKGYCFSIRHWPLYHSLDDIEPTRATYWIQAHGIPREMLTLSNGRKLGTILGSVFEVEDPAVAGYRGFLRLRIDLDASKPLPTCCLLPCRSSTKKIRLQFELLKNFCYRCGRLGHMLSICNHHVSPLLLKLGVVYDQSLVAEAIQKPVYTLPHHPIDFPYIPAKKPPGFRTDSGRVNSGNSNFQIDRVIRISPQKSTNPMLDNDPSSVSDPLPATRTSPSALVVESVAQRKRLDMWNPDTNGTMFRNRSITIAINGITLDSPSWADPSFIPPWAFNSRAEFERANPLFPVPGFDNEAVLVPLPSSRFTEEPPSSQPPLSTVDKPINSKKTQS